MTTATKNGAGTPRKQLSEQLDRLDGVIDALDEGLKSAVADAVREAVRDAVGEAVQAVLTQVLTNPELQKAMRQAAAPAQEQQPQQEQEQTREEEQLLKPAAPPPPRPRKRTGAWGKVCTVARTCIEVAGTAVAAVSLAWTVTSDRTKALALGTVAAVAGLAYACRDHVAGVAHAAWQGVKGLASTALGWLVPSFAFANW